MHAQIINDMNSSFSKKHHYILFLGSLLHNNNETQTFSLISCTKRR